MKPVTVKINDSQFSGILIIMKCTQIITKYKRCAFNYDVQILIILDEWFFRKVSIEMRALALISYNLYYNQIFDERFHNSSKYSNELDFFIIFKK